MVRPVIGWSMGGRVFAEPPKRVARKEGAGAGVASAGSAIEARALLLTPRAAERSALERTILADELGLRLAPGDAASARSDPAGSDRWKGFRRPPRRRRRRGRRLRCVRECVYERAGRDGGARRVLLGYRRIADSSNTPYLHTISYP